MLSGRSGMDERIRTGGDVYSDLLANGKMEDPFFKDNEYQAKALMERSNIVQSLIFQKKNMKRQERFSCILTESIRWQTFISMELIWERPSACIVSGNFRWRRF